MTNIEDLQAQINILKIQLANLKLDIQELENENINLKSTVNKLQEQLDIIEFEQDSLDEYFK